MLVAYTNRSLHLNLYIIFSLHLYLCANRSVLLQASPVPASSRPHASSAHRKHTAVHAMGTQAVYFVCVLVCILRIVYIVYRIWYILYIAYSIYCISRILSWRQWNITGWHRAERGDCNFRLIAHQREKGESDVHHLDVKQNMKYLNKRWDV